MSDQKPDEKQPPIFAVWYESAMTALRDARDRYNRSKARPNAKEREQQLHEAVQRAARVRAFMSSDIWRRDLQPFLRDESADAQVRPWKPGDPFAFAALRTEYFFNSGKAWLVERIFEKLGEWLRAGDEAAKTLDYEKRSAAGAQVDARRIP